LRELLLDPGETRDVVQAIPWVVALVGLFATPSSAKLASGERNCAAQLDKVEQRLDALEKKAAKFHVAPAFDEGRGEGDRGGARRASNASSLA
jgi:hypothetical protein